MSDLDKFYRPIEQGITFQSNGGIAPSVDRLLEGHSDYWISPVAKSTRIKKRLVIADWSASGWSLEKIKAVQNAIADKIAEGFEVSLWQTHRDVSLSQDTLSLLNDKTVRNNLMPVPYDLKEVALITANEHDVAYDDICVIDDIAELLCEGTTPPPRELSLHALAALSNDKIDRVVALIQAKKLAFDSIAIDEYSERSNTLLSRVSSLIKTQNKHYKTAILSPAQWASHSGEELSQVKELTFPLPDSTRRPDILALLATKMPQLTTINFSKHPLTDAAHPDHTHHRSLEHLKTITGLRCDIATFQSICQQNPRLKHIDVQLYKEKPHHAATFTEKGIPELDALESLTLQMDSKLDSASILAAFGSKSRHLKKLKLDPLSNKIKPIECLQYFSHCPLEEIILDNTLDSQDGLALSQFGATLKVIQLTHLNSHSFTSLEPDSLSHVDEVVITIESSEPISSKALSTLFNAAPNLKKINIPILCNTFLETRPKNPSVEKLQLSSWTPTGLSEVLNSCPKLRKLRLDSSNEVTNIKDPLSLTPYNVLALESLSIFYATMSYQHLSQLALAAPLLRTLRLSACEPPDEPLDLPPGALSSLEKISLMASPITITHLSALLKAAPNLRMVEIAYCDNLFDGELDLPPNSLLRIESIALTDTRISEENLKRLRQAAPNTPFIGEQPTTTVTSPPSTDPIITPSHSAKRYEDYNPQEKPFEYQGPSPVIKNQGAIIKQLSQYLTITEQHLAAIPKIQPGICEALSQYFIEKKDAHNELLRTLLPWDGTLSNLTDERRALCDDLYDYVVRYQLSPQPNNTQYLGDNLLAFLEAQQTSCVVQNAWHAIAVSPPLSIGEHWTVYDPNFVNGPQAVTQDQLPTVLQWAIGPLVSVKTNTPLTPNIGDKNRFLEEGGLLCLCNSANTPAMLSQLLPLTDLPDTALDGLLLRDVKGIPAWVRGVKSNADIRALTTELLQQFIAKHPFTYQTRLQKSMAFLSPHDQHELHCIVIRATTIATELQSVLSEAPNTAYAEQTLTTWKKQAPLILNPQTYFQECINGTLKKRLIECRSAKDLNALRYALQKQAHHVARPVFYVHNPNDLRCASPHMHRQANNTGVLRQGPGGPLFDFLTAHPNGVIIVNYDNFNAEELVKFNTFIDDHHRVADGTPVPDDTLIIGLRNTSNPILPGSDFYSRFSIIESCPIESPLLSAAMPSLPPLLESPSAHYHTINLYQAPDWKALLIGHWIPDDNGGWQHTEGALTAAWREHHFAIHIQNGPWNDPEFCRFFRDLALPPAAFFVQSQRYELNTRHLRHEIDPAPLVLNHATLGHFFHQYNILDNKSLQRTHGHIKAAEGRSLPVHLTNPLSTSEWARLLDACASHNVTLALSVAPGVTLPSPLGTPVVVIPEPCDHTLLMQSSDASATIADLAPDIIIDISECRNSDLLSRIEGELIPQHDDQPPHFQFTDTLCALKKALQDGKNVVLTGHISSSLAEELAPFLLQRHHHSSPSGQLRIVSHDLSLLSYLPRVNTSQSQQELRHITLAKDRFLQHNPGKTPADWDAIPHLSDDNARQSSERDFMDDRRAMINAVLEREPYVFLSGVSGTGKSTFVQKELRSADDTLHQGISALLTWATDTSTSRKLLFLDEANLSNNEWTLFAGLFHNPPGVLIQGQYYPLTNQHKVIFAGNPLHYQGGRKHALFFKQYDHHNTIEFKPLPPMVLRETILQPVFQGLDFAPDSILAINQHFLNIYQFLRDSSTETLISPRELQMMALLTASYAQQHHDNDHLIDIARYFAYQIAKPLVPKSQQPAFHLAFKPQSQLQYQMPTSPTHFINVPSRKNVTHLLNQFLTLTTQRQHHQSNPAWNNGGIACLILEGEPGVGKSHQLIDALNAHGYHNAPSASLRYDIMPASLSEEEQKKFLLNAFHNGIIVVIDEINSSGSPQREALLNALLMGYTPEGIPPQKTGFAIIATQNPITQPGRRKPSTALARRSITLPIPAYTKEEMQLILSSYGLPQKDAIDCVSVYIEKRRFAEQHNQHPAPTFRDLKQLAKTIIKSREIPIPLTTSPVPTTIKPTPTYTSDEPLQFAIDSLKKAYQNIQQRPRWHPKRFFFPKQLGNILANLEEPLSQQSIQKLKMAFHNVSPFKISRYRCLTQFLKNSTQINTIPSPHAKLTPTTMASTPNRYKDEAHPDAYKLRFFEGDDDEKPDNTGNKKQAPTASKK